MIDRDPPTSLKKLRLLERIDRYVRRVRSHLEEMEEILKDEDDPDVRKLIEELHDGLQEDLQSVEEQTNQWESGT